MIRPCGCLFCCKPLPRPHISVRSFVSCNIVNCVKPAHGSDKFRSPSMFQYADGLRALGLPRPRAHPRATTFPPVASILATASALSAGPPASHSTLSVLTITGGSARDLRCEHRWGSPLRGSDCALSRVRSEYDGPVTQSAGTPEPGFPGPHLRSSGARFWPWMCHHTWESTVS